MAVHKILVWTAQVLYRMIKYSVGEVSDLSSSLNGVHPCMIKASFTEIYLPVNMQAKVAQSEQITLNIL